MVFDDMGPRSERRKERVLVGARELLEQGARERAASPVLGEIDLPDAAGEGRHGLGLRGPSGRPVTGDGASHGTGALGFRGRATSCNER